jgi:hypothetical protein
MKKLVSVAALLVLISASIFASPVSTEVITGQKETVNEVDLFADVQTTASTRQEDLSVIQQSNEKRFSFDGEFHFGGEIKSSAALAFGILLYNRGEWNIRSHTSVGSYTLLNNESFPFLLYITEKITFGGWRLNSIGIGRPYTSIEGGICLYENQSKNLFSTPIGYKYGFSIGTDINIIKDMALYTEIGIVYHFVENNYRTDYIFTSGFRFFF